MNKTATLAERLRWAREAGGLSARELSRLSGCAESHVGHLERGDKASPAITTIAAIADSLGVSIDWLYRGSGKRPSAKRIALAVATRRMGDHAHSREA
jgi:transcriptional regulator with XRE-family HTH domain